MMKVSVVICTFNRAAGLRDTLDSLRYQRYDNFEVVVVNGPSTDDTEAVLAEFAGMIRAESCPLPNLSMSRNIGIRAASGEIVAFIDDDALPEFDWLNQALPSFDDPQVAGVGGIVFDHSGMSLQYRFSASNRFGETTNSAHVPFDDLCVPGAFTFPYLQGTNALFRRSALEEIGGFDEIFDYYLDETDVCCRLVDAGWMLRQLSDAPVHHKFLPSGIRTPQRVVTNWFPIIKNFTYFAYRHALGSVEEIEVIDHCRAFVERWRLDATHHEIAGNLAQGSVGRMLRAGGEAMGRGIELGRERHFLRLERLPPATAASFVPYPVVDASRRRRIAIISSDYPPRMTGGIARFIGDLAPALARHGHEVRVITRSDAHGTVDFEQGVWVHRVDSAPLPNGGVVPQALPHINDFVTASVAELERIGGWTSLDVVYGPAWDVDVIGALRMSPLPVIAMLATPVAVAIRHAGGMVSIEGVRSLQGLIQAERELFREADLVHAISAAIVDTVSDEYGVAFDPTRVDVSAIGLRDRVHVEPPSANDRSILFVGRLESRKGIHDLLSAIELLAPQHHDLVWRIAGAETNQPGTSSLEAQFRRRNLNAPWLEHVDFLGVVSDEQLDDLYATAEVVVLPSRYESFGLVMVEAMMHGKPLVSCNIGGIAEVVRDGVDGLLVPPSDPDALATAIERLVSDADLRESMGRAGRQRFEQEFSMAAATTRFERLLARVRFVAPGDTGGAVVTTTGGNRGIELVDATGVQFAACTVTSTRHVALHATLDSRVSVSTGTSTEVIDLRPGWQRIPVGQSESSIERLASTGVVVFGGVIEVAHLP